MIPFYSSSQVLPANLLEAISRVGGGNVVIVAGAGCSVEAPTGLPLSSTCAFDAHRRLREDHVLQTDCDDPSDLSCVADAVVAACGSQEGLVRRLPRDAFRNARPNEGHLLAAALLREGAVSCVLTLNFDLAFSTALTLVGAVNDVATIAGPEHYGDLQAVNLIYLHRNVDAAPDAWILRTAALEDEWRGAWEEVIVRRVLAGPVTVFAGLGSPCGVLTESARRIREALPDQSLVFQVDPGERDDSKFANDLRIPSEAYIRDSWVPFMQALAARLVAEHEAAVAIECNRLTHDERWVPEDVQGLTRRLGELGLLKLGRLRARWLLDTSDYTAHGPLAAAWLADLLLCIGMIERHTGTCALFDEDGVVEFWRGRELLGAVVVGHGRGTKGWSSLEARLNHAEGARRQRTVRPRFAVVSGTMGGAAPAISAPANILGDEVRADIVGGGTPRLTLISSYDLRADADLLRQLIA